MAKYEMEKMLMAIEKYRVAHMFVAPPVVIELVKRLEAVKKYDVLSLKGDWIRSCTIGKGCDGRLWQNFCKSCDLSGLRHDRDLWDNFTREHKDRFSPFWFNWAACSWS
ncbi:AMP-dependent synthetase/ligase [Abeliophyllum distichum]|uniref:AMP-dependent synthetase/ligase n=1 Tax=Abeliophyllum distichum TaxID=126358 RepID=A0ABD1V8D4_9LAMI